MPIEWETRVSGWFGVVGEMGGERVAFASVMAAPITSRPLAFSGLFVTTESEGGENPKAGTYSDQVPQ